MGFRSGLSPWWIIGVLNATIGERKDEKDRERSLMKEREITDEGEIERNLSLRERERERER